MITLVAAGSAAPQIIPVDVPVDWEIQVGGITAVSAAWSVWNGASKLFEGSSARINFTPSQAVTLTINVTAYVSPRDIQTQSFSIQVASVYSGSSTTHIVWNKLQYSIGDGLLADIVYKGGDENRYRSVEWVLYHNSTVTARGTSHDVRYPSANHGVYRLIAYVTNNHGDVVTGDSTVAVTGDFETRGTLPPVTSGTMQFIGYAYTAESAGESGYATSTVFPLSSLSEELSLLPGTTHFQLELDPATESTAPDQVAVRTGTGNWNVWGLTRGNITLPYEFLDSTYFIPAPADLRLKLSTESFAQSSGSFTAFRFRVRIKCFLSRTPVYKFLACERSVAASGAVKARRFAFLCSHVDMTTDILTTEKRLGVPASQVVEYTTDLPETLPVTLSLDGKPDVPVEYHRMFYTNQNWAATYDPATEVRALEVDAKETFALESTRPFTLSFMVPAWPTVVQKVTRIHGSCAVYLSNGYVSSGTVISVVLYIAGGYSTQTVELTVDGDYYSPDLTTYIKIGEVSVDISSDLFMDNGIVGSVNLDESGIDLGTWPPGSLIPDPVVTPGTIYSSNSAAYARMDGACYYNAGLMSVIRGTYTGSGTIYTIDDSGSSYDVVPDIVGNYDPKCGSIGMYCYTSVEGEGTLSVPQPLHYPAPYAAPAGNITLCYDNPCFLDVPVSPMPEYPEFVNHPDSTLCGVPYGFVACDTISGTIVVPYPTETTPPDFIKYGDNCFSKDGAVDDTIGRTVVPRADVSPVYDCSDVDCTGSDSSGMGYTYTQVETGSRINVYMNHLDAGIPFFAVIPETFDDGLAGLSAGSTKLSIPGGNSGNYRVLLAGGQGTIDFKMAPVNRDKRLIVNQSGTISRLDFPAGVECARIAVSPGDTVDFGLHSESALQASIAWKPYIQTPRLIATGVVNTGQATKVNSLGFTGLTDRSGYVFYETLPVDVKNTEVNPDSVVTVTASGTEYVLARVTSLTDPDCALPAGSIWYTTGASLSGTLTFKAYASREEAGQLGDMDVWLDQPGTFPPAFAVNDYSSLAVSASPFRTDRTPDITRNSLKAITDGEKYAYQPPVAYTSASGARIVVPAPGTSELPASGTYNGTLFELAGTCPGLTGTMVGFD